MAIDSNVFAQFGPRPKSFMDYRNEMDAAEANALALKSNQLGYQTALQNAQDEAAYRDAAKNFGDNSTENLNMLRQRGLAKQASAYEKAMLDSEKTRAEIEKARAQTTQANAGAQKTGLETYMAKIGTSQKILQAGTTPLTLVQMLDQSVKAGAMTREEAIQAVSDMPQDPAQFQQWREKQLMQGLELTKRIEMSDRQQNNLMIPDPQNPGKYIVNQPLMGAKKDVARAGSSSTNVSYGAPVAGVDDKGNPVFFQPSKGGGAPAIVPGVRPKEKEPKALTEGQAKANLFGTRMDEADRVIGDLEKAGVTSPSILQQVTGGSGVAGAAATAIANPQQQQIDQAQRDFINAVLRRESGAAISPTEFENARKQYFVQPGDAPEVIAQKARNRKTATQGMLAEVPENMRGIPGVGSRRSDAPAAGGYSDAEKERRYQEWKAKQGGAK